jgi:hypothetical protein
MIFLQKSYDDAVIHIQACMKFLRTVLRCDTFRPVPDANQNMDMDMDMANAMIIYPYFVCPFQTVCSRYVVDDSSCFCRLALGGFSRKLFFLGFGRKYVQYLVVINKSCHYTRRDVLVATVLTIHILRGHCSKVIRSKVH